MKGGETYPKDNPLHKPVVTSPATIASSSTTEENGEKAEKIQKFDDETMLRKRIKALENEIDDLKKRIHDLESQNIKMREDMKSQNQTQTSEKFRIHKSSYDQLQEEFEKIKTERDQLQTEIEKKTSNLFSTENEGLTKKLETLTEELEEVKKENSKLKRRLEELTEICVKLEKKETRLAIGQVAWILEEEIWKAVLPHITAGKVAILKSMEYWLKKNKRSADGIAAQKRWDDLKLKLNWNDDDHKGALKLIKSIRNEVAHPSGVYLDEARQQFIEGNYVTYWQENSCMQIFDMVKIVRNLNNLN